MFDSSLRSSPHFQFLIAALFVVLICGGSPIAPAATLPDMTVPQSCSIQLKPNNATPDDLDKIQMLGFKFVRWGFHWDKIEKTKGQFDFAVADKFVSDCKDRGISILGCIAFGNKLYDKVTTDAGRAAYANFAAQLASHYQGQSIIWEIWNEPNIKTFWGSQSTGLHNSEQYADEYVALVKATVPAMKRANPQCIVVGGAVSGLWSESFKWQDFCFKAGVLKTGIDGWSVHPYSPASPEDRFDAYQTVRQMMVASGGSRDFPILNTERGYPLGKAEGYAGGDPKLSRQLQSWEFVRQYMIDLLCGVRLTNWYEWSGKEGFSLYQPETPLPVYKSAQVMLAQLNGYRLDKQIPQSRDRDFVLRFVNDQTGGVKLVAWTAAAQKVPPDQAPSHTVSIPVEKNGSFESFSLLGERTTVQSENGNLAINIEPAPQYITIVPGKTSESARLKVSE